MREIREDLIKAHADLRFRSEYDYALFEYYRSAKVIAFLERAGVTIGGRVLDAGCGGGGMPLSLAEHEPLRRVLANQLQDLSGIRSDRTTNRRQRGFLARLRGPEGRCGGWEIMHGECIYKHPQ